MEMLELTVAEAARRIAAGESGPRRVPAGLAAGRRRRRAGRLPVDRRGRGRIRRRRRPAGRDPGRRQGHLLHRGGADDGRLADPRGLSAALHLDRGAATSRGGRGAPRQDQHGRVRDGVLERELRLRAGAEPLGPRPGPRRLLGRLGRGGRRRPGAVRDRHRHRRLDPPARRPLRDRRHEADLRGDLPLRDDRLRLLARPVRAADPGRHRRGPAARRDGGPRPLRLRPRSGSRAGSGCPAARTSAACASASRPSWPATGWRPGCARPSRRRWR